MHMPFFIFDLDGTLFNTLPDLAPAVNYVRKHYGLFELSVEAIKNNIGNGSKKLVERSLDGNTYLLNEAHAIFLEYYKNHCTERTEPFLGVLEFLKKDFRCAMLTNKPYASTKRILAHFGLLGRFETVLCGDTAKEKKPSPLGIFQILKQCKVNASEALMIGDDTPDFFAAKNAGINCVMILNGFGKPENILPLKPAYTVNNFSDLLNLKL